jgi:hypothetical protein
MASRHFPTGLGGRQRDQNPPKAGQIREKRSDTLVGTLRNEYGNDFAKGSRADKTLGKLREETGKSLHQLLKKPL